MKRDSKSARSKLSDFLLIPPAAAFVSLGMVLPEYLLIVAVGAFLPMLVVAIVQTINRRDEPRHAEPAPAHPRQRIPAHLRKQIF